MAPGVSMRAILHAMACGYVQFARPETGAYDPVCFVTGAKAHNNEYRKVMVDHEDALQFSRIRIMAEVAPSFRRFVERILEGAS
jgi:hypothetical protein